MPKKTVMSRDEMKPEVALKIFQYDSAFKLAANLIRWTGIVLVVYWAYRIVEALAGQTTVAEFDIEMLPNLRASQIAASIWAGAATGYAFFERDLRRRTVERLQNRITELEKKIDPSRTSSKLTTRGETRPEDRL